MASPRISCALQARFSSDLALNAVLAGVLVFGAVVSGAALAGPFATQNDMFRLGATDRLVINRGGPVHNAGDVNGDGLEDVIVGSGVGAVRVVFGPTNGSDGRLDTSIQRGVGGFAINGNAYRVGGGADFNGDGLDDMVVGSSVATHVVFGRPNSFPSLVDVYALDGSDGFTVNTPGDSVALVSDINGDGLGDLLIGSRYKDAPGLRDAGRVTVVFGRTGSSPAIVSPFNMNGTNGIVMYGNATLDLMGWTVEGAGDINADGLEDFVVGATGATVDGESEAGAAYVVYGSSTLPTHLSLDTLTGANGFVFYGNDAEDSAGYSARGAGDINADGIDDLIIGAPGKGPFGSPNLHPGEAYVVFGGPSIPAAVTVDDLNGNTGFMVRGIRQGTVPEVEGVISWGDQAGASVSGAGDINGDGIDDLLIGAPYTIISNARRGNGQVYVIYGRPSGNSFPARIFLSELNGENGFFWNGTGTTDYTGASVSPAGDFNDDGIDDVIIGASGQGESYIMYGKRGDVSP